jgi:multidrug efflux pump subunit AcrB
MEKQMTTIKVRNLNIPRLPYPLEKSKGADAMKISEKILKKVEHLKTTIIPNDVHVEITRNYGNGCG